jgi:fructose-bisphosphate aldolase, class II
MVKGGRNPRLDIERIADIRREAGVPLVLHGGSGIADEDFIAAIKAGISTVHVNTELRIAFRTALEKTLAEKPDEIAPYRLLRPAIDAMKAVITQKIDLYNS